MKAVCTGMVLAASILMGGCVSTANYPAMPVMPVKAVMKVEGSTRAAALPVGVVTFDFYTPATDEPAPLIVVAHGFQRNRTHMTLWGKRLAEEGFVAAVPDLPGWADHGMNARTINQLAAYLRTGAETGGRIDGSRVGYIGLSAGGLATLMAAVENPAVTIWVGLDPVEFGGQGAAAAPAFKGEAWVLRAEPSAWNAFGNARAIEEHLPAGWHGEKIADAIHIDPEWPTDLTGQLLIGKASDVRRERFVQLTVNALKKNLRVASVASVPPTASAQ